MINERNREGVTGVLQRAETGYFGCGNAEIKMCLIIYVSYLTLENSFMANEYRNFLEVYRVLCVDIGR